jgi:hypothetical protein
LLINLAELMRRIKDLKVLQEIILDSDLDRDTLVAALCWVGMEIAEHERFLEKAVGTIAA